MATIDKAKRQAIQDAMKRASDSANTSAQDYTASLLASGGIKDALARMMNESDPTLGQLRSEKTAADTRVGSVFANSLKDLEGITDPRMREAIRGSRSAQFGAEAAGIGGRIADVRGDQSSKVDSLSSLFNAGNAAKQFDVSQKNAAVDRASGDMKTFDEREFQSRFDDLTRREKEASISASNRSNRGGGGGGGNITFEDQVKNPLLGFLAGGGKRVQQQGPNAGFDFIDPRGNKITVEQAAAMVPGATAADFLSGSASAADQNRVTRSLGKPLSVTQQQLQTNALSGLDSVTTIDKLITGGISKNEVAGAKFGPLSSLFGNMNTKSYRQASTNVSDLLARMRTGAQINEEEMRLYKQFVPGSSDFSDPVVVQQKLSTIKFIFSNLAQGTKPTAEDIQNAINGTSTSPDLSAFEQQ